MNRDRYVSIQVLRFIAAALVVVAHGTQAISIRVYHQESYWHLGTFGVDLFFVISGFVMASTTSLNPRGLESGWNFLVKRVIRIVPLYYFYTTLKTAIVLLVPDASTKASPELAHVIASYLFFPYPNAQGTLWPVLGVGWTLIYEFFFYLIFAAAIALASNRLLFVALAFVVTAAAAVFLPGNEVIGFFAHSFILEFLFGLLLAKAVAEGRLWQRLKARSEVGYILIGLGAVGWLLEVPAPRGLSWGLPALLVVAGLMLLEDLIAKGRFMLGMARLGDASYSLYLCHTFVVPVLATILGVSLRFPDALVVIAMCVMSVAMSWLSFIWLERPVTRALSKAWRARGSSSSGEPAGDVRK